MLSAAAPASTPVAAQWELSARSPSASVAGKVYALDCDAVLLDAARQYAESEGFANVVFRQADLFMNDLPSRCFDLVHGRFLLAPIGRDREILDQLTRLVKDGGIIALEEPDATTWDCDPAFAGWNQLKDAIVNGYAARGGDFDAGGRLGALLARIAEFQTAMAACQELLQSPYCFTQTFRLVQAWGRFRSEL